MTKFFLAKIFLTKFYFSKKSFWRIFFSENYFLTKNLFDEIFFWRKIWLMKIFWTKFLLTIHFFEEIFLTKLFKPNFNENFCWPNFLCSNVFWPNFFCLGLYLLVCCCNKILTSVHYFTGPFNAATNTDWCRCQNRPDWVITKTGRWSRNQIDGLWWRFATHNRVLYERQHF